LFRGLIVDSDLKNELEVYRKETTDGNVQAKITLPSPTLEEKAISSMVSEFDKLQSQIKEKLRCCQNA